MRDQLDDLLHDATLTTIAFALAIGWSLYQLAHGVGVLIDGLLTHLPDSIEGSGYGYAGAQGGLTWIVGHRVLALDGTVIGLVELFGVLAVAGFVRSRRSRSN